MLTYNRGSRNSTPSMGSGAGTMRRIGSIERPGVGGGSGGGIVEDLEGGGSFSMLSAARDSGRYTWEQYMCGVKEVWGPSNF